VVFLTDGRAISYAEGFLSLVEHHKLGEIVGQPSAGTQGQTNPIDLPGGIRVLWTAVRALKHDGSDQHARGIQPTIPVKRTIRGVAEGRDEFLERACDAIGYAD